MPETGPSGPEELLGRLEARLDRAAETAERLLREATLRATGEAASEAAGESSAPATGSAAEPEPSSDAEPGANPGARPPPAGWQASASGAPAAGDLELLLQVLGSLRERVPSDLQRRMAEALRELLMAVRALIDWYLERAERERRQPVEVEDIPIL